MFPVNTTKPIVSIEYDFHKGRTKRFFTDLYKAKRFYVMKFNQGKNPKICSGEKTDG
jgi:hypothetical protein